MSSPNSAVIKPEEPIYWLFNILGTVVRIDKTDTISNFKLAEVESYKIARKMSWGILYEKHL